MRASLNFTSGIRLYKTAKYHNETLTLKIKSEFEPYQKDHHRNKVPKEERIYLILYIYYANENLYDIRFLCFTNIWIFYQGFENIFGFN